MDIQRQAAAQQPQQRPMIASFIGQMVLIEIAGWGAYVGKLVGVEMNTTGVSLCGLGKNDEISWPTVLVKLSNDDACIIRLLTADEAVMVTDAKAM